MKKLQNKNLANEPKRQKATSGSILQIHSNNHYYYAQILFDGYCAFFEYQSSAPLDDLSILMKCSVLFIICVYNDIIPSGCWPKVGKLPMRDNLLPLPMEYIYHDFDKLKWEIYNPNTGEIRPSTREECRGLECCSVWDKHHIEDRLSDYFAGKPCIWLERQRMLFTD